MTEQVCPVPWKLLFASRPEARLAIRSMKHGGLKGSLRPYLCPCGSWHLTSMTRREVRQVQKRKAA